MKIGRREHLRQLGLGAAGILGAGLFENDLSRISKANPRVLPKLHARQWPWTNSPPTDNPGIRMIFGGMMIFTYKERQGRVVFHTTSPNHHLEILVFEKGTPCISKLKVEAADIPSKIELISPFGHADDVQYFSLDPDNFDRKTWDDKDFRWLLDLEGPETFSNKDFERTKDKGFNKKLHVSSGCFYTFQRTNSTFTSNVGSLGCSEFSVAKTIACDITLKDRQRFVFRVGSEEVEMQNPSRYEIYFRNHCSTCTTSDFPMVFDAIKNADDYKFDLTLAKARPSSSINDLCYPIVTEGSDESPCMGAAFGGGFGFP